MNIGEAEKDLIRKYARPGPRYTSYPTALQFGDSADHGALVRHASEEQGPVSLYVHLPFCETLCWFCGCNTIITADHSKADGYLDLIEKEVRLTADRLGDRRTAIQVHLGGGTPNFLSPGQIRRLGSILRARFDVAADVEFGVEIDPRRLTREHLEAFREIGANRASFGVQDIHPQVQEAVHRIQPHELNIQAASWLRELGFGSLNIDLIYGLPHQTPETFRETLGAVLGLAPERYAIFNYAHVPWMKPAQKIVERSGLPGPETKLAMLQETIRVLTGSGYVYIGMDHFAKETDELVRAQRARTLQRNFQGYSTRAGAQILAFGVSAISQTSGSYRQNLKNLPAYAAAVQKGEFSVDRGYILTDDDRRRREIIMRIMCHMELDFHELSGHFGFDFAGTYARELASLADMAGDGLLQIDGRGLRVTTLGRLFVRNIAMAFDAYLNRADGRFSKTV